MKHSKFVLILILCSAVLTRSYNLREGPLEVNMNVTEFQEFVDAFMSIQMSISMIPGLVFTMVKDGEVFFTKGYGYADLDKNISVDPDSTVFGVASISKTFVATGLMQLYEDGRLDVFDFPNQYLSNSKDSTAFELPNSPYLQPINIANLLTHSGGVDERWIGTSCDDADDMLSISAFLNENWPPYVRVPNETSTYRFVLNGYILQEVTGIEFSTYIAQEITSPLGMVNSSFGFPYNDSISSNYAMGYYYDFDKNEYGTIPTWYIMTPMPAPDGSMKTTANDMNKYMLMHLQNGSYGGVQILKPSTVANMHSQHYTMDPELPGYCYCLYEYYRNGIRAIMHEGDIEGFASVMFLIPDANIGFFMSMNRVLEAGPIPLMEDQTHNALRQLFIQQFLDRYLPPQNINDTITPTPWTPYSKDRMERFAGYYAPIRSPHRTFAKILRGEYVISVWSDGGISLGGFNYVETSPNHFSQADDPNWMYPQVTFREDDKGHVYMMIFDTDAYERIPVYGRDAFTYSSIGIFSGFYFIFILIIIGFAILMRVRNRGLEMINVQEYYRLLLKHEPVQMKPSGGLRIIIFFAKLFGCIACLIQGSFLIAMYFYLFRSELWGYGVNPGTVTLLLLPSFGVAFTGLMTIFGSFFVCLIRRKELYDQIGRVEVVAYLFVNALLIIEIPWLVYWNFMGLKY